MKKARGKRWKSSLLAVGLWVSPLGPTATLLAQPAIPAVAEAAQPGEQDRTAQPPDPSGGSRPEQTNVSGAEPRRNRPQVPEAPADPETLLMGGIAPISLADALNLAGVQNPQFLRARALTSQAIAVRQQRVLMLLPNLGVGANFDAHTGNLQQSNGNIIKVTREALNFGFGLGAVAAGTTNRPGLAYDLNIGTAWYNALRSRQLVRQRQFETLAQRNQALLRVALAYNRLLRAEGRRAIAVRVRDDAERIYRITSDQSAAGQTKISDAERATNELARRKMDVVEAEREVLQASARLAQEINLDPAIRLHAIDGWVVPAPIVPTPLPLKELVAIAVTHRPELAARKAAIQGSLQALRQQQLAPWLPQLILGYSASDFGGGSNLAGNPPGTAPVPYAGTAQVGTGPNRTTLTFAGGTTTQERFGNFAQRTDIDAIYYWTFQNIGLGNFFNARQQRARLAQSNTQAVIVLNQVRQQVAQAYADVLARFAQIDTSEQALRTSRQGFQLDTERTFNKVGLPIEVLDNLRLLSDALYDYLDAITAYNQAHYALYVALGCPTSDLLAQAIPPKVVPAPADALAQPSWAPPAPPAPHAPVQVMATTSRRNKDSEEPAEPAVTVPIRYDVEASNTPER